MKSVLINLHNHLIDDNNDFYSDEHIKKCFANFININCEKIYAFTDHFDGIVNLWNNGKIEEYIEKTENLFNEYSKRDINILFGIEIDVIFRNSKDCKHLLCIFRNVDAWYQKIKNFMSSKTNKLQFSLNEPLDSWYTLLDDSLCIPHYAKTDSNRNFTKEEISLWNKFERLPKITCLEIASNIKTYWYSYLFDTNFKDNYHCIVGNDRKMSQLSSFIYFNNNVKLSKENLFDNILNFFNQTEHMTTLSVNGVREEVTLDIKFTINISKNCLIYGKRGSGKSYLCKSLCKALLGCDNINNNVIDNDDKICYIEQGAYINKEIWKNQSNLFREKRLDKLKECCKVFTNSISNYEFADYRKETINNYLDKFINNVMENIRKNEDNNCCSLNSAIEKFGNLFGSTLENPYTKLYEKIDNFIKQIDDIISEFNPVVEDVYIGSMCKENIKHLRKIKLNLLKKSSNMYVFKSIADYRNNVCDEIEKVIDKEINWQYKFKFKFFDYFCLKMIREKFNNFIKNNREQIIPFADNKYALKYTLHSCRSNYFKISSLDDPSLLLRKNDNYVNASDGEQREFLILNKIKKYKYDFFILDEPEYAFDNVFLKNLAREMKEILSNNNKRCFLVTHNNVFWSEIFGNLKKDKTYVQCDYNDNKYEYDQKIDDKDCNFMEIYEAGKESYNLRSGIYNKKSDK